MSRIKPIVDKTENLIEKLREQSPAHESIEWYVIINLKKFQNTAAAAHSMKDVLRARDVLSRFAIESLNWDSELMKAINQIVESVQEQARLELQ